ncbi:acyltransferase family protein [Candidatus Neomarinimicrobiota bacterium]
MDNLRTIIIFLVILYHAGGVYECAGTWAFFWLVDDPATYCPAGFVNIVIDIFVMPTLFFISGYLTPMSLKNKNRWSFLKARFRRLMIPWIIAVLTLIPLYKVIFLYSRGLPQEHWTTYFHFTGGSIYISQNWLWFLPVLFLFNSLYVLLSKVNIRLPNISLKGAVIGTFLIGLVYSLGIGGILGFRNWTTTLLIDFENERLLLYFMIFLLGSLSFRQNVFTEKSQSKTLYIVANSTAWIPITIHIFARLAPFMDPEGFSITPLYRVIWWLSFYLSLLCLVYLMIESFWRYLDKSGRIWGELNKNSYYVYIIHVIVLGGIALLLLNLALPSLLKYLILVVSTILASNLIISLYRRVASNRKAILRPNFLSGSRR